MPKGRVHGRLLVVGTAGAGRAYALVGVLPRMQEVITQRCRGHVQGAGEHPMARDVIGAASVLSSFCRAAELIVWQQRA